MDTIIAVHQCLFCPQTFGTAAEKDDHLLEHFAQETCIECDQNLIRIGSNLYTLHNAVTCVKVNVKIEQNTVASSPINHPGYITETDDDIYASGSDNDDWSTTFSMIKESIRVDERIRTASIDECEQANVVLTNEDNDDFMLTPQISNGSDIEIEPTQLNVVDGIIEDGFERTHLYSENRPESDVRLTNSMKTNHKKRKDKCDICGKILLAVSLYLHKRIQHAPPGTYICRTCHREFPNEKKLSKHRADCLRRKKSKYPCNICGKIFSRGTITLHMRTNHSSADTPVCDRCGKIFSNEEELSLHRSECPLKRKSIERGHFECDICKKVYPSKKCIQQHINWMHNPRYKKEPRIPCNICGKVLRKKAMFKHKAVFHSDGSTYLCKICSKKFPNEAELFSHKMECVHDHRQTVEPFNSQQKREIHNDFAGISCAQFQLENEEDPITQINEDIRLKEEIIDDDTNHICFEASNQSQSHELKKPNQTKEKSKGRKFMPGSVEDNQVKNEEVVCDICGLIIKRKNFLQRHMQISHSSDDQRITCMWCGRLCMDEQQLNDHKCGERRMPVQRNDVVCDFCGKISKNQFILQQHQIRFHSAPNVHACYCARIFKTSEQLEKHRLDCAFKKKGTKISLKLLDKTLECYLCHKVIKGRQALTNHVRTQHVFGKKFKCELCERRYFGRYDLQIHYDAVHLNIRNFICSTCGKSFKTSSSLKGHQYTHKTEKNLKCKFEGCEKYFISPKVRDMHMRIHTGRKYICPIEACKKQFASSSGAYRHRKKVHGLVYKKD